MGFGVITEVKVMVILLHVYIHILSEYVLTQGICVCKTENSKITIFFLDGIEIKIIPKNKN